MTKITSEFVLAGLTAIVCWLLLSYFFFPIKLTASPEIYFAETISYLIPLKGVITAIIVLLVLFIYEQKTKGNDK